MPSPVAGRNRTIGPIPLRLTLALRMIGPIGSLAGQTMPQKSETHAQINRPAIPTSAEREPADLPSQQPLENEQMPRIPLLGDKAHITAIPSTAGQARQLPTARASASWDRALRAPHLCYKGLRIEAEK